jgi:hypothetical protein
MRLGRLTSFICSQIYHLNFAVTSGDLFCSASRAEKGMDCEAALHRIPIDRGDSSKCRPYESWDLASYILNRFRRLPQPSPEDRYNKPSVLFIVCQESRLVAFEAYDVSLSISLDPDAKVTFERGGSNPERVNVPHEEVLSPGYRFQPTCNTVWLMENGDWVTWKIFTVAEPNELKTDRI